ncbi:MAG TPA: hypothetical protein DEO65_10825 [Bacillus bacterium]|uniref:hypothetical protein n=1 Tax=Siminovitchia fordii TaxID=254759 RepID=UPI00037F03EE|nr:hypothetical protein [Siminovitchia fordii]HBZ10356.1 hypothetical protein [Bacillus sp. (in: firmicutes)]
MLTYVDVEKVLPEPKGYRSAAISFGCISFSSSNEQKKGLFIQIGQDDDLQAAISNGAVAAVWPLKKELPFYTPNDFPVFLTEEGPLSAAIRIIEQYSVKLSMESADDKTLVKLPNFEGSGVPLDIIKKMEQLIHSVPNDIDDGKGGR